MVEVSLLYSELVIGAFTDLEKLMPLTADGSIIVDDVAASNYVSIDHEASNSVKTARGYVQNEHNLLHWWMAPYRMMCMGVSSRFCNTSFDNE